MALMSIFSVLFSKSKKPKKSYISAFVLLEENIKIIVFEKQAYGLILVESTSKKISKENYTNIGLSVEEILTPLEKRLGVDLQDVLFVVPSCSLDDSNGKMNQTYRLAIKQIVKEFEFNALGYVDLFEVVESEAKANDNWIYLERNLQSANIFLCTKEVLKKKLKVTSDADEICAHIEESSTKKSKIFYFTDVEHDDVTTFERNLASYDWVSVSSDDIVKGTRSLLQNQLYEAPKATEVATLETQPTSGVDNQNIPQDIVQSPSQILSEDSMNSDTVPKSEVEPTSANQMSNEGNFVQGQSTKVSEIETKQNLSNFTEDKIGLSGFAIYDEQNNKLSDTQIGNESGAVTISDKESNLNINDGKLTEEQTQSNKSDFIQSPTVDNVSSEFQNNPNISQVANLQGETKSKKNSSLGLSGAMSLVWPSVMAMIVALLAGTLIFLHRAEVTLVIETSPFETEIKLSDFPVNKLQNKNEIFSKVSSSGTKEIGERAKGIVSFASFDDKVASFSAGTTLEVGKKVYKLDADVSIEPASLNIPQGTKVASKKSVAASSTFIGPEGNLDKGAEMLVVGHPKSLYYAVAESAFAGGSRQTVDAISEEDINTLEQKLYDEAEVATAEAKIKLSKNDLAFTDISETSVEKIEFSASVGDAKTEVSATAIASSSIYYGSKNEVIRLIGEKITAKLGDKAKFNPDDIEVNVKLAKLSADGKKADMNLVAIAHTYQEPSIIEVQNKIAMKPVANLGAHTFDKVSVINTRHVLSPNIFPFNYIMPIHRDFIKVKFLPDDSETN